MTRRNILAPKGFILMTALPPTKGHAQLIQWAAQACRLRGLNHLYVLVCGTNQEPVSPSDRAFAIKQYFLEHQTAGVNLVVDSLEKDLPNLPKEASDFWFLWTKEIQNYVTFGPNDYIFGSDHYIYDLSSIFGIGAMICDPNRETVNVKATTIRNRPLVHFNQILPTFQRSLKKTITIFGAESTGKTTTAKALAERFKSVRTPEWARPYLESLPTPETNDQRMEEIVYGQAATELAADMIEDTPFVIRDTDLLSTIGYYRLYSDKNNMPSGYNLALSKYVKPDLALIMSSEIPMTPDPLRYGGQVRESTDDFWINLCKEFGVSYETVAGTKYMSRLYQAESAIESLFEENNLWKYQRST